MNQITAPGGESNHSFLDKDTRSLVKKRKTRSNDPATSASRFGGLYRRWRSARIRSGLGARQLRPLLALLGFISLAQAGAQEPNTNDLTIQVTTAIVDANDVAVSEVPEHIGSVTVRVTATTSSNVAPAETVPLSLSTRGGTATALEDYEIINSMFAFVPTEWVFVEADQNYQAVEDFSLAIVDDALGEDLETLSLRTERGQNMPSYVRLPQPVELAIVDNDGEPTYSFSVDVSSITEAGGVATVRVSTGGITLASDQEFELTLSGTATVDTDYTVESTTLTLAAGQTEVTATITAVDDTDDDDAETVVVTASQDGTTIGSAQTITIEDDDVLVRVTTVVVDANGDAVGEVSESIGDLTVRVTAATNGRQKPAEAVKFRVAALDGTAFLTEDFEYLDVSPVLSPSEWVLADGTYTTKREYVLSIVDDPDDEPARETVHVITKATTATADYVTLPALVEIVILDDDTVPGQATSLEATAAGPTAIDLSWTAPSDPGTSPLRGYRIAWSADGRTSWRSLAFDTNSTATTYTDTGLAAETTRHYRVSALSAAGIGQTSEPAGATTDPFPVVTIVAESTPVTEGGTAIFVVTRTGSTDDALEVSVEVSATGSLALSVGPETQALRMAPGSSVHRFRLVTQDDNRDEEDRTVTVTVGAPEDGSYEVGSPSSGTVVVEDDDDLAVQVTTVVVDANGDAVGEVSESIGDLTVLVTAATNGRQKPAEAVKFRVAALDGTAFLTEDFESLDARPVLSAAEWVLAEADGIYTARREYVLSIVDDPDDEPDRETVDVVTTALTDTPDYVTLPGLVQIVILDDDVVPGQATSLEATAAGPTAIDLSWTAPSNPGTSPLRGYWIEWSADGATLWKTLVLDTNSAATTFSDTGLTAQTTRHYRVSALSAAGIGQTSEPAGATTDPAGATTDPSPVVTIVAESTPVTEGGTVIFVVTRTGSTDDALEVSVEVSATGSLALSVGPETQALRMAPGSSVHRFRLVTQDDNRDEEDRTVTVTVGAPEDGSYEVGSPSSGTVVVEDDDDLAVQVTTVVVDANGDAVGEVSESIGDLTVLVTAATNGRQKPAEAVKFRVAALNGTAFLTEDFEYLDARPVLSAAEWVLAEADGIYTARREYVLSIVDDPDDEPDRETVDVVTTALTDTPDYVTLPGLVQIVILDDDRVPGRPTSLEASAAGPTAIDLSWTAPSDPGTSPLRGYQIEWSEDGGRPWRVLVADTNSAATKYTDTGLTAQTTRYYRVSALSAAGIGQASEPADARTNLGEPAKVEVTIAVVDANGVVVTDVPEEIGTATIRVTATTVGDFKPTNDFRISVRTRSDVAVAPADYTALSVHVEYQVSDWVVGAEGTYGVIKEVSLAIIDDTLEEPTPETFRLLTDRAANTPGYVSLPPRLKLAIIDNDAVPVEPTDAELPEVVFSGWTPEVTEGAEVTFTLSRTGDSSSALTVAVEVSETGSTIRGTAPTSAVFDAGEERALLTVQTIDDSIDEPDSVISVTLTAGQDAGYVVGSGASATVTVSDDDHPPSVVTVPGAPKDLEARADGEARIDLNWTAPTETGGAAITGYRIEWSPDGASDWSVLVEDTGSTRTTFSDRDLTAGTNRHYRVHALNSAGIGPPSNITGARTNLASAEVTITAAEGKVTEGADVTFVLSRTGPAGEPLTVLLDVADPGLTIRGTPPASVSFAAGAGEATLVLSTVDDPMDEPDRDIMATLLSGDGYTLGSAASATVQVRDNDAAPVFSIAGASTPESRGNLMFQVTLQGQSSMPVKVEWNTSPGTATADRDYTTVRGVLTLDPGSVGGVIVISLHDDALFEENETFTVSLSRPKNAKLSGTAASATGVIENDDAAPVIRIVDASASESAGAMTFRVALSGESALPARVRWASSAGTAQADLDYVEMSGELIFGPGTTSVGVEVLLIEDLLHEESETFRLVLSGATNAMLDGASEVAATGTIEDDDDTAPAEEWLARFGRTAASNAVNAVEDRLTGRLGSGAQVVVAGHRVDVAGNGREHGAAGSAPAPVAGLDGSGHAAGGAVGLAGPGGGLSDTQSGRYGSGRMGVGDVLARSSFQFSSDSHASGYGNRTTENGGAQGDDAGVHRWSVWGNGAATRFNGGAGDLSLDGEVVTGTVGADMERGRVLFGVAVSHSQGDGDYRRAGGGGLRAREGDLSSDLTTGLPYLRVEVSDRLSVWGALGRGSGSMTLSEGDLGSIEADIGMSLGAFGARQELRSSTATDGFSLALRTDLLLVHTTSDETAALPALSTDVNRLRLMVEGERRFQFESGAVLTPNVELGLRYDDGDAETGSGLEVGAGLRLENAARGLSAELTGRSLLAHEASELSEWGVGGSLRFEPGGADRGLSIGLRSTLGAASSGIISLWEQQTATPVASRATAPGSVTEAEIGYGLAVLGSRWSLTPYLGAGLSGRSGEAYKAGARLRLGEFFALDAEAARVERNDATPSVYRAALLANLRW